MTSPFVKHMGQKIFQKSNQTRFDHALKLFSILSIETNLTVSFRLCSDVLDQGLWGYMDCSRNFLQWYQSEYSNLTLLLKKYPAHNLILFENCFFLQQVQKKVRYFRRQFPRKLFFFEFVNCSKFKYSQVPNKRVDWISGCNVQLVAIRKAKS